MRLRLLDLFSGVGGFSLGLERSGAFRTEAFCEIDPFCRRVLAKHWPDVPCHDDVTTMQFEEGQFDAICGGFPCQDVSVAGKRAGVSGSRSGLYRELVRAIRVVRPRVALLENVAALLNDGMGTVIGDLAESGACVEWDCVPAQAIGAPHERDRVWIVVHSDSERFGETGEIRHRPKQVPSERTEARPVAGDVADIAGEQVGIARQPRLNGSVAVDRIDTDAQGERCGQGRSWRPPDSFARVRDTARRNAADPLGARLAFRGGGSDAEKWRNRRLCEPSRESDGDSIWPDEPALQGVDDGTPHWLDRVRATGNGLLPQIPELIGRAIAESLEAAL